MINYIGKLTIDKYDLASSLTQIVSIDLLIKNDKEQYLLGKRLNSPAKNSLFVPGGRIYKGEHIMSALTRIIKDEINIEHYDSWFYGLFDHYYKNESPSGRIDIDTHYVSIAFRVDLLNLSLTNDNVNTFLNQHENLVWMTEEEILESNDVHIFTKNFFDHDKRLY
jgi:colanic acid biosynthesis protein WcaH